MTEFAFYSASLIAVFSTLMVVTGHNPVHALLYLVLSLLSVAVVFFTIGAPFAGVLEVIVYAGAIMVLFVFVVMMLNLGEAAVDQERRWMQPRMWVLPAILASILLAELILWLPAGTDYIGTREVGAKAVGILLYGPYLLAVELASFILTAALVAAYHLGRQDTST
ncbi:MAG TPA: NADH-quinone oxidoreductase subunit J [Solimonas sp.]|nr:NADH-quinone oxidoreductase subunit J [Solimonas sp.]